MECRTYARRGAAFDGSSSREGETNFTQYLSGWSDAMVIKQLKDKLKPQRVEDYEIQFEAMKLKHSGPQSELWLKFETWAADWLALEREAQSQGVEIEKGRMRKLFEAAVRYHPSIERIVKGRPFSSCKEWYGVITKELHVIASYASQLERDEKRESTAGKQQGFGRGQSPPFKQREGRGSQFESSQSHQGPRDPQKSQGAQSGAGDRTSTGRQGAPRGGAATGNHMQARNQEPAQLNTMEPMTWQGNQGDSRREVGRGIRGGRGRGSSAPPFGRGDRNGQAKGEQFGTRIPINDPRNEDPQILTKGPFWHENGDLLKCSSANCGRPFDSTIFCQGCGWKGHSRQWCYKASEPGFNATGYWSINKKGQAPLPGKNGEFRGQGRANHMDASEDQTQKREDATA